MGCEVLAHQAVTLLDNMALVIPGGICDPKKEFSPWGPPLVRSYLPLSLYRGSGPGSPTRAQIHPQKMVSVFGLVSMSTQAMRG